MHMQRTATAQRAITRIVPPLTMAQSRPSETKYVKRSFYENAIKLTFSLGISISGSMY